jgi:hypothetical protein
MTAQQIFDERFGRPHDPRSKPYKAGVLYILRRKAGEIERQVCPHATGSSEADAWYAGVDEGLLLWRAEQRQEVQA